MGALAIDEEIIRWEFASLSPGSMHACVRDCPAPFLILTLRHPNTHPDSARLLNEELHKLRNHHRVPYANPLLDKYLGEATFDGKRWHVIAGIGSLALNALLLLMVWALQGTVVRGRREKGTAESRQKSE